MAAAAGDQPVRVGGAHLTYCTNIHPGESWSEIRGNLERFLPRVKVEVSPDAPFGVGLRLSAAAARSLQEPAELEAFARFLRDNGLYVFTINAFPYGAFHGTRVKENVYLPDWRDDARIEYTNDVARVLAALLPEDHAFGSISTVPGAFKASATTPDALARIANGFIRQVADLAHLERETGRRIVLAIEPEPCCVMASVAETVAFFETYLHSGDAATMLSRVVGTDVRGAERMLRRHLGVCVDLCHAAVEFEDPAECVDRFERAGILIGKMQITAGLRVRRVDELAVAALRSLEDGVYLHQVVESATGELRRYADIDVASAAMGWRERDCEWRVHFHVPVFLEALEGFASTQAFVRDVLRREREHAHTPHLEVETYTWSVLPPHVRDVPMESAIARELRWVRGEIA